MCSVCGRDAFQGWRGGGRRICSRVVRVVAVVRVEGVVEVAGVLEEAEVGGMEGIVEIG